ncbi:hypothetical protein GQ53DRAFT_751001 [Thozetella sp. PMI_491]|nr:hypothetical protein GQ53DRAFT_751001 [Thozetella sp. PMI_491]
MGSGDLNQKKSWHTAKGANIAAVAKAEAEALTERKKLAARLDEIREERLEEARQKELEANGGKRKVDRVEWMYAGPGSGQAGDTGDNEGFLLGKRRIDKLLQDKEVEKLKAQENNKETLAITSTVNNVRDTAYKVSNDPLFLIRQQEQAAYAAIMADPSKRRRLLESMGIKDDESTSSSKERRHKHRHHHRHHRHRDDDSDGERRSHKRRRSDSRDRSRSPKKYDSEDEDRHRRRRDTRNEKRYRSSPDDERESRDRREDRREDRQEDRARSRTPPRRRRDDSRDRRDSRRDSNRQDSRDERRESSRRQRDYDGDRPRYNDRRSNGGPPKKDQPQEDEERARKLAAMQEAASDLDKDRERRITALEESERKEREADDEHRQRSRKYGGDRAFMNNLHRKAGETKLADRVGQGRKGFQRDDE